MKPQALLLSALLLCNLVTITNAQDRSKVNYDESKIKPYVLPDLLTTSSGKKVNSVKVWEEQRRPEIMKMFMEQMYGVTPTEKINVRYEIVSENRYALDSTAIQRQVKFIFTGNGHKVEAMLLLYMPNKGKDFPVLIGYNFNGNHTTIFDRNVCYPTLLEQIKPRDNVAWVRGSQDLRWPFKKFIANGYAVATMCYHDIYPDKDGMRDQSVAALFSDYDQQGKPDEWKAIGAWAWGASRIADYLETEPLISKDKMALVGHSRLGKVALWAGAQDSRFKIVIANDSGEGGAALSRRNFGETVALVSSIQPSWFCDNYNKYRDNESALPFDQHMLLALIAPRKLYIASADEDLWADPKGEYLSAYYASPVYKLYGLEGLTSPNMPSVHQPIMNSVGYHIRSGKHEVMPYDMECFLEFCQKWFR
jgi:hypothetical protein